MFESGWATIDVFPQQCFSKLHVDIQVKFPDPASKLSYPNRGVVHPSAPTEAMFTLYRIGFCSVSKVAPIQCEQELMFCCGAEVVPKRSQCEHKPCPSYNLQCSLLI